MSNSQEDWQKIRAYVGDGEKWRENAGRKIDMTEKRVFELERRTQSIEITLARMDSSMSTLVSVAKFTAGLVGVLVALVGVYVTLTTAP